MRKFLAVILAVLFAGWVCAEWTSLGNSRGRADLQVKLLSSTDKEIQLEITVPGYEMKTVKVEGKDCVFVHIPGSSFLMKQGCPLLPRLGKLVMIGDRCDVTLKVLRKEEIEVSLPAPIIPSKGHLTRNIDPKSVRFEFGPIYGENVYWPDEKDRFSVGKPFIFKGIRGVRLEVLPVVANHVQMKMKVLKKAVVSLVCEESGVRLRNALVTKRRKAPGRTFRKLYKNNFLNYAESRSSSGESVSIKEEMPATAQGTVPNEEDKNLVVVTPSTLREALDEWITWKKKCGYTVTVHEFSIGTRASDIKAQLQKLYDAQQLGYVVLIGDAGYSSDFEAATPTPTFKGKYEEAAADRVYVRLAGDDNYPDAFISRISDTTVTGIKNQLAKIIAYEQNPPAGDWYTRGICIASDQGDPDDRTRAEWLQNGGGEGQNVSVTEGGLIQYGYTDFDDIYDPTANSSMVSTAVDNGRSIICYIGHGSSTSWVSSGFDVSDIKNLNNAGMLPHIWSVACVNGDFLKTGECFAEAWLRKVNGGAVAVEAASTNESWVPPCDKQSATVNAIINKTYSTFGALEVAGLVKAMEYWKDDDFSEGNKMAEQCHLFGDCTTLLRTRRPLAIESQIVRGLNNDVNFTVVGEGRAQESATVTVYTEDLSFVVTGETDVNGNVNLSLKEAPAQPLRYTIVGQDLIAEVDKMLD